MYEIINIDYDLMKKMLAIEPELRYSVSEALDTFNGIIFKKNPSFLKYQPKESFELGTNTLNEDRFKTNTRQCSGYLSFIQIFYENLFK